MAVILNINVKKVKLGIGQMSIHHNFLKKRVLTFRQPICKNLEWEITRSQLLSLETCEKFLDDSDSKILKQSSEAFLFEKMRRYLLGESLGFAEGSNYSRSQYNSHLSLCSDIVC